VKKIESVLKLHPLLENICVCGRSSETFCVALIVPSKPALIQFAKEVLNKEGFSAKELTQDRSVCDAIADAMLAFGKTRGLEKFEIPRKIALVTDEWTPDSGHVTAAMKLRRKVVEDTYALEIDALYLSKNARKIPITIL